jgi:hypothetical protein
MHSIEGDDDATVFRDVILLALLGFVTIVVLLLPHLNPPTKEEQASPAAGNLIVEVRWEDQIDADVDLWVEAPGDEAVGYSNKGGHIFNLLRDDLGHKGDITGLNYEMAFSRGAPAGDYTVNLHLYRHNSGPLPMTAVVAISIKMSPNAPLRAIITENVNLLQQGQEITVTRFSLDDVGSLVPGSVHDLPRPLRSGPG